MKRSIGFMSVVAIGVGGLFISPAIAGEPAPVTLQGKRAELVFACDSDDTPLQALFADGTVAADLKQLSAGVCLVASDLTAARAAVVQRLNQEGIPTTAWLVLPKSQGYYLNASNGPAALDRYGEFEAWTKQYHLKWSAVGLDIEPTLDDPSAPAAKAHSSRVATFVRRYFDFDRVKRAHADYTELLRRIHSDGYVSQTYQLMFIATERAVHTTLLERELGIVDVRGDDEILMLYSSFTPTLGSALIWKFGPVSQTVAIGSTQVLDHPDPSDIPLDWTRFSSDLVAASHYSHLVGVYCLEGCVQRGYLSKLKTFDWNQTVTIPPAQIKLANQMHHGVTGLLWIASRLPYILAALILALGLFVRWLIRRRRRRSATA
ncbi:MAG TPA: hypothetical protein VGL42_00940 [Opitutaceae bacterium]